MILVSVLKQLHFPAIAHTLLYSFETSLGILFFALCMTLLSCFLSLEGAGAGSSMLSTVNSQSLADGWDEMERHPVDVL